MTTAIANSKTTDEAQLRALIDDRVKATEARACGYLLEKNVFELRQMLKSERGSQAEHRED